MKRRDVRNPSLSGSSSSVVGVENGGTGVTTAPAALALLGGVPYSSLGNPGGPAKLINGKLPLDYFGDPNSFSSTVKIHGIQSMSASQTQIFSITNYDVFTAYNISAVSGTVSRTGPNITYIAPATAGLSGFIVNGKTYSIAVSSVQVQKPDIVSPLQGATGLSSSVTFTSSNYVILGGSSPHQGSDWQISTSSDFSTLVNSVTNAAAWKTSWTVNDLLQNTTYYVRTRHNSIANGYSQWSSVLSFSTKVNFLPISQIAFFPTDSNTVQDDVHMSGDGTVILGTSRHSSVIQGFERSGGVWYNSFSVNKPSGTSYTFQRAVLSEDKSTIAACIYPGSHGSHNYGAVVIYRKINGIFQYETEFSGSHTAAVAGHSLLWLSFDGNKLIFGNSADSGLGTGNVKCYSKSGSTWTLNQTVAAPVGSASFAYPSKYSTIVVDPTGTTMLVKCTIGGIGKLLTYTYSSSWTLSNTIDIPENAVYHPLALSNDKSTAALLSHSNGSFELLIYTNSSGNYLLHQSSVEPATNANQANMKIAISSNGSVIAYGNHHANNNPNAIANQIGSLYLYKKTGSSWSIASTIYAPNYANAFGISVSMSSNAERMVVSGYNNNHNSPLNDAGVYIFE